MTYIKSESHAYLKELVESGAVKAVYHYACRETKDFTFCTFFMSMDSSFQFV